MKTVTKDELIGLINSVPLRDQEALIQIAYKAVKPLIITYINQYKAVSNQLGYIDNDLNTKDLIEFQQNNSFEMGNNPTAEKLDPLLKMFSKMMQDLNTMQQEVENIKNGKDQALPVTVELISEVDKISDKPCLEHQKADDSIADKPSENGDVPPSDPHDVDENGTDEDEVVQSDEQEQTSEETASHEVESVNEDKTGEAVNDDDVTFYSSTDEEDSELKNTLEAM